MKNRFLILIIFIMGHSVSMLAIPANSSPLTIIQLDGSKITFLMKGDEHFSFTQTTDGLIILTNAKGIYEYADLDDANKLVPSGMKANNVSERNEKEKLFIQTLQKQKIAESLQLTRKDIVSSQQTIQQMSLTNTTTSSPVIGTKKMLCLLIGFPDKQFTKTQTDFNSLMNQNLCSVKNYYLRNSYNQLNLDFTVVGPFMADHNLNYYGGNNPTKDYHINDLINEAIQKAHSVVNYSNFDNNGDGYVDGVYVVYAGYDESYNMYDPSLIWAKHGSIPEITLDGKKINEYACSSEIKHAEGNSITGIGTICHELGHLLGAHDFYDTNYATGGTFLGTWQWDVMGSGSENGDGLYPAYHNPYTKTHTFGWATAHDLPTDNSLVTLQPAESNANSFYKLNTATPSEYFLLENRRPTYDSELPGSGMLIYHVNSQIESDPLSINVTHPQKFYPVCASASQEPNSDPASYQVNSIGCPYPGAGNRTSFSDTTIPSAKSWAGAPSGKGLYFIREVWNNIEFMVNPTITGPTQVCDDVTYSLDSLPDGATVVWSSNRLYPNTGTGDTYTVSPISYAVGGYVSATITIGSSTSTIYKNLEFNCYPPIEGPDEDYLSNQKGYFDMSEDVTVTQWAVNGVPITPISPNRLKLIYNQYIPGAVLISCNCETEYGTFVATKELTIIDDMGYFTFYPNPATNEVQVSMTDDAVSLIEATTTNKIGITNSFSVKIIDSYGVVMYSDNKIGKQFSIPVSGLKNGIYTVFISDGERTSQKKLVVKH